METMDLPRFRRYFSVECALPVVLEHEAKHALHILLHNLFFDKTEKAAEYTTPLLKKRKLQAEQEVQDLFRILAKGLDCPEYLVADSILRKPFETGYVTVFQAITFIEKQQLATLGRE